MGKDFFDGLGEAISKTARELSGRAENLYETQKIKNRISGEEKQVGKIMAELGRIVYKRYLEGVPVDDAQKILCEQIDQRMDRINHLKEGLAGVKGRKICPSCGSSVDGDAAFCSYCGAACPTRETEEDAGDVVEDIVEETVSSDETESSEENDPEKMKEEKAEEEVNSENKEPENEEKVPEKEE